MHYIQTFALNEEKLRENFNSNKAVRRAVLMHLLFLTF